jgi:hypothetical protein
MLYTILLGLATGSVAMFAMGDSPGWGRLVLATLAGLAVGLGIDVVMSVSLASRAVVLPLYPPFGLTESGLIAIPFSLIGAALAARRNWARIRDPNDLRR